MRLQHKLRVPRLQAFGQRMPIVPAQYHAKMRHGHVVAIHRIGMDRVLGSSFGVFVDHQLMAEEIEVDPMVAGATLFQAEDFTVEVPSSGQVVYRDCQVERRKGHQVKPLGAFKCVEFSLALFDEKTIVFAPSSNYFDQSRRPCCGN